MDSQTATPSTEGVGGPKTKWRPDLVFSKTFSKCVTDGIGKVAGPSGTWAILFHSRLFDAPHDPSTVHRGLATILSSGSKVVEDSIAKEFLRMLSLPDELSALEFEKFYALVLTINRVRARDVDTV